MVKLRRSYIDGIYGQVHALHAKALSTDKPLLVCLHATAYSSESLRPLLRALGADRNVVAFDTPGYGGSDAPPSPVAIEDYADALADAIARIAHGEAVDIFGYHTGATIAVEIALRHPSCVRALSMVGVPLFDVDRAEWQRRLAGRHNLGDALAQFEERWRYLIDERPEGMSLERAFGNFVDELRTWPRGWWAHAAVFAHDLAARLPLLSQPALIINPESNLAGFSRAAAALIPDAILIERPDISGAIFDRHAGQVAALIGAFLDRVEADKLRLHGERPGTEIAQARTARADHVEPESLDDDIGSREKAGIGANYR